MQATQAGILYRYRNKETRCSAGHKIIPILLHVLGEIWNPVKSTVTFDLFALAH